ncbi:uncharacterized protein LOC134204912 [Armigeres subalbatus]|uniref:uncharacterized protein LOC134204912 n=1 Tax=Armigeres subalbatus TaxID=124917 RepID=UPI002ED1BBC2
MHAIQQRRPIDGFSHPETMNASSQTEPDESAKENDNLTTKVNKCLVLLSHVNTKLDAMAAMQCEQQKSNSTSEVKLAKIRLQPIKSLADLEALEDRCRDDDFVKTTVASIGKIHGRHRFTSQGATVSLQIVDHFFSRDFLMKCSWTGISRTSEGAPNNGKIPFMKYERMINLFHQTVLHSDPNYTLTDCKNFLHRCLKNSKQRFEEVAGTREPVSRKRKRLTKRTEKPDDEEGHSSRDIKTESIEVMDDKNPPDEATGSTSWQIEFLETDEECV